MLMARVVVAWTTPFVAKSVPLKEPMAKVAVVAFVVWKLVDWSAEEKSVVVVALVACKVVWKAVVVVAFVPWKVVVKSDVEVARSFADYEVSIDEANLPSGVTLIKRV